MYRRPLDVPLYNTVSLKSCLSTLLVPVPFDDPMWKSRLQSLSVQTQHNTVSFYRTKSRMPIYQLHSQP